MHEFHLMARSACYRRRGVGFLLGGEMSRTLLSLIILPGIVGAVLGVGAHRLIAWARSIPAPKVTVVERTERCTVYRIDRGESRTHIADCKK